MRKHSPHPPQDTLRTMVTTPTSRFSPLEESISQQNGSNRWTTSKSPVSPTWMSVLPPPPSSRCLPAPIFPIDPYNPCQTGWSSWSLELPPPVTAYFDLSSYLYLSRLIHDASLIIPELSVLPDRLYRSYIRTRAHVNAYRTYPLSRYSATILLNAYTRVSATYLPILYGHSHAHSPFLVDSFRVIPFAISLTREAIPYCRLRSLLYMIVYLTAH